jgi:hypothetical protein
VAAIWKNPDRYVFFPRFFKCLLPQARALLDELKGAEAQLEGCSNEQKMPGLDPALQSNRPLRSNAATSTMDKKVGATNVSGTY